MYYGKLPCCIIFVNSWHGSMARLEGGTQKPMSDFRSICACARDNSWQFESIDTRYRIDPALGDSDGQKLTKELLAKLTKFAEKFN